MGSDGSDLAQQLDILLARGFFAGQDQLVGPASEHFQRRPVVGCARELPGGQYFADRRSDLGIGAHYKSCFSRRTAVDRSPPPLHDKANPAHREAGTTGTLTGMKMK